MADGRITANDIIDVEGISNAMNTITSNLDGLKNNLKEIAEKLKIQVSTTGSSDELAKLSTALQSVADAMGKLKDAERLHQEAVREVTNEIKVQVEAEKVKTQQEKTATEQEKQATEIARQYTEQERQKTEAEKQATEAAKRATESSKQNAEATKAQAKANAELAVAQAKVATEQAKQAKIQQQMNSVRQQSTKLTQDEINSLEEYKQKIADVVADTTKRVEVIEIEKKSYNELYATYNALKDALNAMTTEERLNTEAGKSMTQQSQAIMETMNKLQQSTGKFTLNVGNYRSAFDGLGFSITQVARELPSLTVSAGQFFLAISNNIPMVVDELDKFKKQQSDIQAQLSEMRKNGEEATEQYRNLSSQVTTLGKKLLGVFKSFAFWITIIVTAATAIAKHWKDITGWVQRTFGRVKALVNPMNAIAETAKVTAKAFSDWAKTNAELTLIKKNLDNIKEGTEDWKNTVARVAEITGNNIDSLVVTKEKIRDITDEYLKQSKQIALNNAVVAELAESDATKQKLKLVSKVEINSKAAENVAALLGIDRFQDGKTNETDGYKKLVKLLERVGKEAAKESSWGDVYDMIDEAISNKGNYTDKRGRRGLQNAVQEYANFVLTYGSPMTDDAYNALESLYKPIDDPNKTNGKGRRGRTPQLKDVDTMIREAMEARANVIEKSYAKELALIDVAENQERYDLKKKYDKELEDLNYNHDNMLISTEEYEKQKKELNDNYRTITESLEKKYQNQRFLASQKEAQRLVEIQEEADNNILDSIMHRAEMEQKILNRRVRNVKDEESRNRKIIDNINTYRTALEELKKVEISTEEGRKKQLEDMDALIKKIEKLQSQLDVSKKMSLFGNIGDILKENFDFGGNVKEGILAGLFGDEQWEAVKESFGDNAEALSDFINTNFDKWFDSASSAVKTWWNNTIDYIGDVIEAYAELSQAKVDAAKSDADTAKEAYEREKALLEAGYANSIDAAYREYREKKAIQDKAEADAKEYARIQQELDTATQASAMIVAIANLYKALSAGGAFGVAAASALSATMLGAFVWAKAKAYEVSKYGEGGFEMVEQGGSHASGNDTELGVVNSQGKRMVVERNEGIGVFSTMGIRRYGRKRAESLVYAFNHGTLDNALANVQRDRQIGQQVLVSPSRGVSLAKLERGVDLLAEQANNKTYIDGNGNTVVQRGNVKTTYLK